MTTCIKSSCALWMPSLSLLYFVKRPYQPPSPRPGCRSPPLVYASYLYVHSAPLLSQKVPSTTQRREGVQMHNPKGEQTSNMTLDRRTLHILNLSRVTTTHCGFNHQHSLN